MSNEVLIILTSIKGHSCWGIVRRHGWVLLDHMDHFLEKDQFYVTHLDHCLEAIRRVIGDSEEMLTKYLIIPQTQRTNGFEWPIFNFAPSLEFRQCDGSVFIETIESYEYDNAHRPSWAGIAARTVTEIAKIYELGEA